MARTTGAATDLITFSRASSGTALTKVAYGPELVTNGTFDTDTDWTKGTGWTISGGSLLCNVVSGYASAYQSIAVTPGETYLVTFDAVYTSGLASVYMGTNGLPGSAVTLINQTQSYSVLKTFTGGNTLIGFRSENGAVVEIDNISVKQVTYNSPTGTLKLISHPTNKPRVEYDANGVAKGLLIEEARTNFLTYSEDFTAGVWAKFSTASLAIDATGPDGQTSAVTFIDNASGGTGFVFLRAVISGVSTSSSYTLSFFAKANGLGWLNIRTNDFTTPPSSTDASFDLTNGVLGTVSANYDSAEIKSYGGGWYRCSVTFTTDASDTSGHFDIFVGDQDGVSKVDLDGTSSILIYGAQLEQGSFPTSYIPTSGATATRSADIASVSLGGVGYNDAQGTVTVEFDQFGLDAIDFPSIFSLDDGTHANRVIAYTHMNGRRYLQGSTAGATVFSFDGGVMVFNQTEKWAAAFATNDFAVCVNGGTVQTDTVGTMPPGISVLNIGKPYNLNTNGFLSGHIKSINYYPLRLSDAKLQELTS